MVMFEVHSHPVLQKYKSHFCSRASLFQLFVVVITFLFPLLVGYISQGFWLKETSYKEQPEVYFKHQFLVFFQGLSSDSYFAYSTYQNFNNLVNDKLRVPVAKSYEEDVNMDGKNDLLHFTLEMPLSSKEIIYSVQLLLIFDYKLQVPVIDSSSVFAEAYDFTNIFEKYFKRNVTTKYVSAYPVWKAGRGTEAPFILKATVYYPEERIFYRPGFWQLIKFAWIQYFSILVIFLYLFGRIKRFVFENQIVITVPQKLEVEHLD